MSAEHVPRFFSLLEADTRVQDVMYAIEPTAQISRRPQAHDAVAGPGVHRVARMV